MTNGIAFSRDEEKKLAVFRYGSLARYSMALLISLPITAFFFYTLFIIFLAGIGGPRDLLFILAISAVYAGLMIGSNLFQAPLLNPQWIFTSVRTLTIRNKETGAFQLGIFPFCLRRKFLVADIGEVRLVRQRRGRGLGFFLYFISQPSLYSLLLIFKSGKNFYLSDNEPRNGSLAEEGRKLAEHLNVPFKEDSGRSAPCPSSHVSGS